MLPPDTVESGHLVVLCDNNYPPYSFIGPDGSPEGIVLDQWKAWSSATGIAVEVRPMAWESALEAFDAGKADVLDTVFETPARRIKYDFTSSYATLPVPLFVHRSISGIASLADLRGFRVAAKAGDAVLDQLRAGGIADVATYPSYEDIVRAAAAQNVKVFTIDQPPALYLLYKYGIDRDFRIAFELTSGQFHRAVRKGDSAVLTLVEQGFAALPESALTAIDQRWMGRPIGRDLDWRLIATVGMVVLAVILFLLFTAWALRRRVAIATAELRDKVGELERSEGRTRAALADKEVLLKEVHHRVKNNMQVISSLIELASYDIREVADRKVLDETQERIRAMAQLHELLYRSDDLSSIDAGDYLEAVVNELVLGHSFSGIEFTADRGTLDIDRAVPLGLIANELVLNAIKYAYPGRSDGIIRVSLRIDGSTLLLAVQDEGRGFPQGTDPRNCGTMGLTLVRNLAAQIRGRLEFKGPPGVRASLVFTK